MEGLSVAPRFAHVEAGSDAGSPTQERVAKHLYFESPPVVLPSWNVPGQHFFSWTGATGDWPAPFLVSELRYKRLFITGCRACVEGARLRGVVREAW